MDNRYNYFADEELNEAVRQLRDVEETAQATFRQWREKMVEQVVVDILETLDKLKINEGDPKEAAWRATAVLKFLISDFASGLLYGHEKVK
jgi:hypothetical protein